jgi:Uma2 family endonuclease
MIVTTERRYTLQDYRAIAEQAEEKYEYRNGEIVCISGGSATHSRLSRNLLSLLDNTLQNSQFEAINNDLRLWIPNYRCGVYPDVMVFEGALKFNGDRQDEVLNPLLIGEVLSPSTEEYDRTDKFQMYRSIPSFSEYLLIRQNRVFVEHYYKQPDGWRYQDFDSLDQLIPLNCLDIELAIAKIYRNIQF